MERVLLRYCSVVNIEGVAYLLFIRYAQLSGSSVLTVDKINYEVGKAGVEYIEIITRLI